MDPDGDDDDRLLSEVLGGERAADDAEVIDLLRRRPELREELASLQRLVGQIEAQGQSDREELAGARGQVSAGDVEAARRAVALHGPRPARRRWGWPQVAAVAALLVVGLSLFWRNGGGNPADTRLTNNGPSKFALDTEQLTNGVAAPVVSWRDAPLVEGGYLVIMLCDVIEDLPDEDTVLADHVDEQRKGEWELRAEDLVKISGHTKLGVVAKVCEPGQSADAGRLLVRGVIRR